MIMRKRLSSISMAALLAPCLFGAAGCGAEESTATETGDDDAVPLVEMPPADGAVLVVLEDHLVVRDRPSESGEPLGTLRIGARVPRAAEPYTDRGCPGGWFPIRPRGFVCVGAGATIDLEHPIARTLTTEPRQDRPLPYRYGRVRRGAAVIYDAIPARFGQQIAEPDLAKRAKPSSERLGAGANDVPLDEHGLPTGPPVILPKAEGVGPDGYRTTDGFWRFPSFAPPVGRLREGFRFVPETDEPRLADRVAAVAPGTRVLRHRSRLAVVGDFPVGEGDAARQFGLLPDGRFVPVDRLAPELGTIWHGVDLSDIGLPLAFTLRAGVRPRSVYRGKSTALDEEYAPQQALPLTGRYRTVERRRHYHTQAGPWVRAKDIIMIFKRHEFPDWATGAQKWIDVSLANQTLTAYEGRKPVYATLLSSGRDRLGDPEQGPSTIQGIFRVQRKAVTAQVDDREVERRYALLEVPWVMEFADGFALTGCHWLHRFGEARSHHNIALAPIDARWLFRWSDPQVPERWHGVLATEDRPGTIVYVHK